jgi:hypothetical protein
LEKIKHGFKTLAECGGIRGVDDTSSFVCVSMGKVFKRTDWTGKIQIYIAPVIRPKKSVFTVTRPGDPIFSPPP